ncbi:MAG TPA: hypothetical protein ENN78_00755 [Candidatus Omnitrophica bacterium]|nr:hypothetical protein [Candidatus Omnitrophota bacterium]
MPVYQSEYKRIKDSKTLIDRSFPEFGRNKKQEASRLIFEISKREGILPKDVLKGLLVNGEWLDFSHLKTALFKRRFPYAWQHKLTLKPYLPELNEDKKDVLFIDETDVFPKNVYVEEEAASFEFVKRLKYLCKTAKFHKIPSLSGYIKENAPFSLKDYNERRNNFFIFKEGHDFFKRCPCTKKAIGCGYHIFNLEFGCVYECTYCYLQQYSNSPGVLISANLDRFFDAFKKYKRPGMRLGTGEFADSLALDYLTQRSPELIDFFNNFEDVTFEFKTKSASINNLLKAKHRGNIVISWSLNPQSIIDKNEFYSASLKQRLDAASKCVEAGYRAGFHFDPIIYSGDWEKEYKKVVDRLFSKVSWKDIAWISLGTLRFAPQLKVVIERRFPNNNILDGELYLGFDAKMRYPEPLRFNIYKKMLEYICTHSKDICVYLCMEDAGMFKDIKNALRCLHSKIYLNTGRTKVSMPKNCLTKNESAAG